MCLVIVMVCINVLWDIGVLVFSVNNYNVIISENILVGFFVINIVVLLGVCFFFLFYLFLVIIDDNEKEVEVLKNF